MKRCLKRYAPCLFLLLPAACTEPIDVKSDASEPVIAVYGIITNELKEQEINLSRSLPYFEKQQAAGVSGAKVTIRSAENETHEFRENPDLPGQYLSVRLWAAKPEVEYELSIEADFNRDGLPEKYEASTTLIPPAFLDSAKLVPMNIMGHFNYALNLYGQDAKTTDYYLFRFAVNGELKTTALSQYTLIEDFAFNGQYINQLTVRYFDDISEEEKDPDEARETAIYLKSGDEVDIRMSLISKDYFEFIRQSVSELRGGNPLFGGPPSNIVTNISNGGVGFFSGYCINSMTVPVN
jgi:hypothetical protein